MIITGNLSRSKQKQGNKGVRTPYFVRFTT